MAQEAPLPVTQWIIRESGDKKAEESLVKEFGVSRIVSQLILNRQVKSLEEAQSYLYPSLNDLHSPFLMKDMKQGVARLIRAIANEEKIVIYGDYDDCLLYTSPRPRDT